MEKLMCITLSLFLVFGSFAFSAPVKVNAEISTISKGVKPGLNMLNQTTEPYSFEGNMETVSNILTGGSRVLSIVDNPTSDAVNSSTKSLIQIVTNNTGAVYPPITFALTEPIEAERPIYSSFKYLKRYEAVGSETPVNASSLWIMKNTAEYVAQTIGSFNIGDSWKNYSGFPNLSGADSAFTPGKKNTDPTSSIIIEAAAGINPGSTKFYYDDIMYMPSYKISYMTNDGTTSVVKSNYFLLDSNNQVMTSYSPDLTVQAPYRYGYYFRGWSLRPDAATADAPSTIALANEDIVLYAVWEKDLNAPEPTIYKWNFEDSLSQVWTKANSGYSLKYENGMAIVDTSYETYINIPYLTHPEVSLDTRSHRYLVVKARSLNSVSRIKFMFKTSANDYTANAAVSININPNSGRFNDYYFDMSQNPLWTGNYKSCMMMFENGSGVVEIEEIYFTTVLSVEEAKPEYHYSLSTLSSWGTHSQTNTNGLLSITVAASGTQGATNIPEPTVACSSDVYKHFIIKAKSGYTGGIYLYFMTSSSTAYNLLQAKEGVNDVTGTYTYYDIDLGSCSGYTGNLKNGMLKFLNGKTIGIVDIYLVSTFNSADITAIDKFDIYAPTYQITEEGGSVTLSPYVRCYGSTISNSATWITDSVNGTLVVNTDGSATVTGKMNGDFTIKAKLNYDNNFIAEKKIIISGQTLKLAANKFKLLTFGNSIMLHPPLASLGWTGSWGMAASALDKDYVHRLIYYMDQKYGEGTVEHFYGGGTSTFERAIVSNDITYDYSSYITSLVNDAQTVQPDIITIQLGENVNGLGLVAESYEHALTQFVSAVHQAAPNAMIVLCTSFWAGDPKIVGAANAAKNLNIPLAKLHILNTNENKAIGLFENSGVASHPGDTGMDNIAKLLFEQINIQLSSNEKTVYTDLPNVVEFLSTGNEITTEGGTLQLAAHILPADAAQDIVWSVDNSNYAEISEGGFLTAKNNGVVKVTATSRYNTSVSAVLNVTISGQADVHTVTYDKNTTDIVTNLPQPNTFAKGNFVFDAVYPERDTFNFIGWSLTIDGEIVDSVEVTEDITVYAQWEKASKWSFERAGYKERFTVEKGFNQYVLDGVFMSIATGTDVNNGNVLKVISPILSLDAEKYPYLVLKMQNTAKTAGTTLAMTVKTTNGYFNFTKSVTTTDYVTYVFDLANVTGTITGFEFTPTNIDCTINLDEIEFVNVDGSAQLRAYMQGCYYSNNEVSVNIAFDYILKNCTEYVAIYDNNGKLVKIISQAVASSVGTAKITLPADETYKGYSVKVFFWDNTDSIKPLGNTVSGNIT